MASIGGRDTGPELALRRWLHARGYRYRLCVRGLPGSPDIVFPSRRKVIFVHGCFWHRHDGCRLATSPKTRQDFWQTKFVANVERDRAKGEQLRALGWDALVVWQCEIRDLERIGRRVVAFLGPTSDKSRAKSPQIT
jgi:DNA mismatch endonuclease (patch repair protein)